MMPALAMGQVGTIVRDVDATKKFWGLLGGTSIKVDGVDVVKFPGVLIFLRKGEPKGGSLGTAVDHPGFHVPNGQETLEKFKVAGVKSGVQSRAAGLGYIYSPDDLRVEILGNGSAQRQQNHGAGGERPLPHLSTRSLRYGNSGLVRKNVRRHADVGTGKERQPAICPVSGCSSEIRQSPVPTKGRALDYIGFEVKNLEAFCKKLEANGVKLDQPYSKVTPSGLCER